MKNDSNGMSRFGKKGLVACDGGALSYLLKCRFVEHVEVVVYVPIS